MADIVIFGAGQIAEVAKVYMDAHSGDRIVGFTVDSQYAKVERFHGLPVVPWENLEEFFPPSQVWLLGPLSYRRVNEFRRARYLEGKRRNYRFASFIHPNSHVYTKEIGENCFILEANVIQPFVKTEGTDPVDETVRPVLHFNALRGVPGHSVPDALYEWRRLGVSRRQVRCPVPDTPARRTGSAG